MYAVAAVMMVAMAALLRAMLPVSRPDARIRYRELLSSIIPLARKLPALRQAAIMSGFAFGAFSAYWTTLVFFLEKPPYHYGAQMAGLLGLAGVAGALAAPAVGVISDHGYPRLASGCALSIGMIAFGLLWTVGGTIAGLAIGEGRAELTAAKHRVGSFGYASQYLQNPIARGGNLFKENWFGTYRGNSKVRRARSVLGLRFQDRSSQRLLGLCHNWPRRLVRGRLRIRTRILPGSRLAGSGRVRRTQAPCARALRTMASDRRPDRRRR
jgi:hypothetical protein